MGEKSFDVITFGLALLRQGQTRTAKLKSAYNSLIIDPRGLQCETNLSDLTFTGSVGELSFRWIQICVSSPMCRPSYYLISPNFWFSVPGQGMVLT